MRSYSVTVTMTPRQAVEAERALRRAAVVEESGRLFSAAHRITCGLIDAGWEWDADRREYRRERAS